MDNGDLNIKEVKTMENGSSIWKLCMTFGVMVIALAAFMSAVSAAPLEDGVDNQREAALWGLPSEDTDLKISSSLALKMKERQSGGIAVIIELKEQPKVPFDVREAKSLAAETQQPLSAALEEMQAKNVKSFWIINAVSAKVPVQNIDEIAARTDVRQVWLDKEIRLIEPVNAISGQDYGDDMVVNSLSTNSTDRFNRKTSSADEIATPNYIPDHIQLYLRHKFIGPPYDQYDYLSEYPDLSDAPNTKVIMYDDGENHTWGDYSLDGDITGTNYSYWILFASASSTTFRIEIIINGTTVATFPDLTVPSDPYYQPFSEEMTGMDPAASRGDEVMLKITKISGGAGKVLFGTEAYSNITIPPLNMSEVVDYADEIINAPQMWDRGYDGSEVIISILDSGIDDTHPDLNGKVIAAENFTDDGVTDDLYGHGTHCAGIAAGKYNATTDVTGVAPGASLINAKVFNQTGDSLTSWIISGIEWSVDQNADILSMSFGGWQGDGRGRDLESMAVTNAIDAGHVVVIAARNEGPGEGTIGSPAVAYGAIAVAASDSKDAIVDFSSRGPTGDGRVGIDVAAPGHKIIAPNAFWESQQDYATLDGTSMSCPHVAGAAALLLEADSSLTPGEVETALKNGADVPEWNKVVYYAFDIDDIDNTTIQRQLINNSENWLRVVRPTYNVLMIDDDDDSSSGDDQSVGIFTSVFEDLGYDVKIESSDETSYPTWSDYDIVVWSCGDDDKPIRDLRYKEMLVEYVTDGGHLILESGHIAAWIGGYGAQIIDRELREKVLHTQKKYVYSDVGDLKLCAGHSIATTPNVLPGTINFTPTNPGDDSGDADAVRILPDAMGVYNWSYVAYGNNPVQVIASGLIAYEKGYDVWEQGAGRLDVKDAYDALTNGIMVDSQWFVGRVRPGSYTKTFTVMNNNVTGKTVSINRSTGDAGDWMTLPANLTVPAGGTANFNATMDVLGDAIGAYKGSILVNDGIEEITIPVSVNVVWNDTGIGDITGSVDEDGDWVYYTLDVPVTANLNLSLNWTNSINDLDLELFNPDGTLAYASVDDKPEMITVDNPSAGYWTVAINAWELQTAQETYTLNISVSGDRTPPSVTCPTATPVAIAADGIQTSQLNVTVTDPIGIGVVTVNLSAIGGSEAQEMGHIGENVYSTTTNASKDTEPGPHCLQVHASDVHGNCNDSVCIELWVSKVHTIQLDAGWNMVSIPVIPADASVDAIFGDNITPPVYGYDAGYKSVTSLEPKKGYWVLADSPVDINITGTVPANREVTVFPGWNMIGPVSPDVQVSSFTGITPPVYGYDAGYKSVTTLEQTKGYWVLTSTEITLTV